MAVNIGSVSCTFLRALITPLRIETNAWRRAGLDGYGLQLLGKGQAECQITARYVIGEETPAESLALIEAWYTSIIALQGTIVSAEDDHGLTPDNIMVMRVGALHKRRLGTTVVAASEIENAYIGTVQIQGLKVGADV